jgi:hypothetical protein
MIDGKDDLRGKLVRIMKNRIPVSLECTENYRYAVFDNSSSTGSLEIIEIGVDYIIVKAEVINGPSPGSMFHIIPFNNIFRIVTRYYLEIS